MKKIGTQVWTTFSFFIGAPFYFLTMTMKEGFKIMKNGGDAAKKRINPFLR